MVKTQKRGYQLAAIIADIIIIVFFTIILIHLINVKNGKSHYIFLNYEKYETSLSRNKTKSNTVTSNTTANTNSTEINTTEKQLEESQVSGLVEEFAEKYIYGNELLIFFGFIYILIVTSVISHLIGRFGGKIHYAYYKHYLKKNNPYQYYRELPNNFGVAIASLIVDSSIENKKDIIAVILDLCAKGYLELEKDFNNNYNIKILNNDINQLLPNEQYVIRSITDGKLKQFNYTQWYNCCKNDAIRLGLITEDNNNINAQRKRKSSFLKKLFKLSVLIGTIVMFILVFNANQDKMSQMVDNTDETVQNVINVTTMVAAFVASLIGGVLIAILVVMLFSPIYAVLATIKNSVQLGYKIEKGRRLNLTEYGKAEVKKLFAFEAFLKDFGLFASKNPEEITLWEYYLSYAQVFGLTDEILKTGYKQIIKKGSIQLEDINTISVERFMN